MREGFLRAVMQSLRPFWPGVAAAAILGALSGGATMFLLGAVNRGLHAPHAMSLAFLGAFAGLCTLSIGAAAFSGLCNTAVGQKLVTALRKDVAARILHAPLVRIEELGSPRILAVLTTDIDTLSAFTLQAPALAVALATAGGSFAYLFVLSRAAFVLCAAAALAAACAGAIAQRGWTRDYEHIRETEDALRQHYRAITDGAKELRLNRARRARVHGFLLSGAVERIAQTRAHAMRRLWLVDAIIGALFFLVIAVLLAGPFAPAAVSGAVLVLLFAKGPVEQIIAALPQFGQARASFERIAAIAARFSDASPPQEEGSTAQGFEEIALCAAQYTFADSGFTLGPIDLAIRRGETVFIVGENGSGKTTLIKLLLGLYRPTGGALLCDGVAVTAQGLDDYRQRFSAVFSDFFLFEDLPPGHGDGALRALKRLALAHKVTAAGGRFTTTALSGGERKRLALAHVLLEDRPIVMFDEWAADQDPSFRRVFYEELLPALEEEGRTLIVVSHDDRYFGAADRIVRLRDGRIVDGPAWSLLRPMRREYGNSQ